jgi:hypothetical protein
MLYTADVWCGPVWKKHDAKRMIGSVGLISKLSRVQRISALHTTGALRTTATDALNAHADLFLPTRLYINRTDFCSAVRLASLPRALPLRVKAHWGVERHRSPMDELFRSFGA